MNTPVMEFATLLRISYGEAIGMIKDAECPPFDIDQYEAWSMRTEKARKFMTGKPPC